MVRAVRLLYVRFMAPLPTFLELARMIDHSLLDPTMTDEQLAAGLRVARCFGCATACVHPCAVPMSAAALAGSTTGVCAVVGFPHGHSHPDLIAREARRAITEGAAEIDMVINAGKVLGGDWDYVRAEIRVINESCTFLGALLKVIFENDYLSDSHIIRLCEICTELRVAFIKTSTGYGFVKQPNGGYGYKGATDHHLALMRRHSGPGVQIKAAGGVRSLADLLRVRALGVTRIGATATEAILAEAVRQGLARPLPPGAVRDAIAPSKSP